ncbi:IS5/IS1182 family transposase [Streptomyces sp. NPDC014724]|nr:IS5/IS1182 family transposase [Nocardia farcinica]AXK89408.1 IS5/IS1182 family transposase [Nocardia farcinica]AXK89477.1 IS5/IS1182 family transposase [Nocardia farcinica]AXK89577.1 IS5/IS1182 family transposase [Nocardia farcinica]MBF6270737.1 IS5/IS1182 family transposase [Nocardia farcinica]
MVELFSGLRPRKFARLITRLRREGADRPLRGRPWGLCFEDRVLLVATYWRTNLTMRQLAAVFGVSKSAAARVIEDLGPALGLRPRVRFPHGAVLIVDGTLVPTRDHDVAAPSKNYRYSTNHQVVIDADTELVVALGRPLPGNRNDCRAYGESGAAHACRNAVVIADGGYQGTSAIIPHRRVPGRDLPEWKQAHNASHRKVRARVEHTFSRMKTWKILRDCRLRGNGVAVAMAGVATLANLAHAR